MSATPLVYFQSGPELRLSTHTPAAGGADAHPRIAMRWMCVGVAGAGGERLRWPSPDLATATMPLLSVAFGGVCIVCVVSPFSDHDQHQRRRQRASAQTESRCPPEFLFDIPPSPPDSLPVTDTGTLPVLFSTLPQKNIQQQQHKRSRNRGKKKKKKRKKKKRKERKKRKKESACCCSLTHPTTNREKKKKKYYRARSPPPQLSPNDPIQLSQPFHRYSRDGQAQDSSGIAYS